MKRIIFFVFVVLFIQCTTFSAQANAAETFSTSTIGSQVGTKRVVITQPSASTLLEFERPVSAHPELDSPVTLNLVTYNTFQGLFELEQQRVVPTWYVDEALVDAGVTRVGLQGAALTKSMPQVSIDLDNLTQVTNLMLEHAAHPQLDWACGSVWSGEKEKSVKKYDASLNKNSTSDASKPVKGSATFAGSTEINLIIKYKTKKNKCIGVPYKAEFISADLDFKMVADQNLSVSASYSSPVKTTNLFYNNIPIWSWGDGFWVYFFYIDYSIDFNVAYGADLTTSFVASISSTAKMSGTMHKKWVCTKADSCVKVDMADDTGMTMTNPTVDTSISGDIKLQMYVDANMLGHVGFYKMDFLTALDLTIGIRAELPIRYFFYAGNTCSDANGDGTNEYINAGLIDVTGYIYGYLKYKGVVRGYQNFPIKVAGWTLADAQERTLDKENNVIKSFYHKNIYFKSFGDNKIFEPVLKPSIPYNLSGSTLSIDKRSCYPFNDGEPIYLVEWGDNTSDETQKGAIPHGYASTGMKTITAKPLKDLLGRTFDSSAGTKISIMVNNSSPVSGSSAVNWLIPATSLLLL